MIPFRYILVLLCFFGMFNAFASRICFNIALVAMVNYTSPPENQSEQCHNLHDMTRNATGQVTNKPFFIFLKAITKSFYRALESLHGHLKRKAFYWQHFFTGTYSHSYLVDMSLSNLVQNLFLVWQYLGQVSFQL